MPRVLRTAVAAAALLCAPAFAQVDDGRPAASQPPAKSAKELIRKQEPFHVFPEVYAKATPENTRIVVNLATQRLLLLAGTEVCIDTPISSGKRAVPTPTGTFAVLEKIRNHQSANYGNFVDRRDRVVRSGVSMKLDVAPPGTHYVSVPMSFFLRFADTGFGIHGGTLPGYPVAHGSIRVPEEMIRFIHDKVRVGTPIEIRAE
ncbi:MAG: L,D-transpeptidase [Chthoniobacteraceae bacterium]